MKNLNIPTYLLLAIRNKFFSHLDTDEIQYSPVHVYKTVRAYGEQYGYVPEEWQPYMRRMCAWIKYMDRLEELGEDREDYIEHTLAQLRDVLEELDPTVIETVQATANGGKHVVRTVINKAS